MTARWAFVVTARCGTSGLVRWRRFLHERSAQEYCLHLQRSGYSEIRMESVRVRAMQPMICHAGGNYPRGSGYGT